MPALRIKRGTRAQLDAAKTAGTLAAGEPYLITDEARLAVGTATNAYAEMAKQSEAVTGTFPFYKADGSSDSISLTADRKLPFYVAAGTASNIALVI